MTTPHTASAYISRRSFLLAAGVAGCTLLAGCSPSHHDAAELGSAADSGSSESKGPRNVRFGTTLSAGFLPGWAAERDELFPASVEVDITSFQSEGELYEAVLDNELDMALTTPAQAAMLSDAGTPVRICWTALEGEAERLADENDNPRIHPAAAVVIARNEFYNSKGGAAAVQAVQSGWDKAARMINASPEDYRDLLDEQTGLPAGAGSGPLVAIPEYPTSEMPEVEVVQAQVDDLYSKGKIEKELTYDEQNGIFEE